jgi:ketosteroid isomerase-like protein
MSIEENKRIATEFFARFSRGDVPGVLELMSEDASWRVPGKPGTVPICGVRTKPQMARLFAGMKERLKGGVEMWVKGLTAEGDRVAVEVESRAELQNGRIYGNEYHFLMVIRDGQIRTVHEYYDTQHTLEVWFAA